MSREFRTGSRPAVRTRTAFHERIIVIAGIALLAIALLVALARRDRTPAAPPPQEARVVTVPVPMPVEQPAPVPVVPPAPVPVVPPAPMPAPVVRPAPVALAAPAPKPAETRGPPSASELVALYRSVGQMLDHVEHGKADELWQRYRWIRLADYLTTADRRAEAARMLDAIASDARRQ